MINEKEFKETYSGLNHDQLLDLAYRLQNEVNLLLENNASYKRSLYGRKRELVDINQLSLFNEAEVSNENVSKEELDEEEIKIVKRKHSRNSKLKELKVKRIDIKMDKPICDICGGKLSEIKPKIIKRLVYKPSELYIEETIVHQYTCHNCSDKEDTFYIFQNDDYKEPRQLIKGSMVTSSFIANVAYKKYVQGVPYYRQEKELNDNGIPISRQVMCNWFIRCGDKYLKPIFNQMEKDIRNADIINMDETTLLCLEEREKGRESKGYEWLCITNEYEAKQMALYYYKSDRSHSNVSEILTDNYKGIIQSDGYQAYKNYTSAKGHAGCLSHARRKFEDYLKDNTVLYKKLSNKGISKEEKQKLLDDNPSFSNALWFVNQFDKVFKIERKAKADKLDIKAKEKIRNDLERPLLEQLYNKALSLIDIYAQSGKLYKALNYVINQWSSLIYYLDDGRIPASNNLAEREGIKPFVMARKNFLFADTINGAQISSIWFSLIISARLNKLNIEKYLTYVLEVMSSKDEITDDLIDSCLPYSSKLPDNIKL